MLAHAVYKGSQVGFFFKLKYLFNLKTFVIRKLVCAFANPMELDNHNKTEAGALLEVKLR